MPPGSRLPAVRQHAESAHDPARPAHGVGWQLTSDQRLAGIEWDPESNARLPLVVIDGKGFTWEQVGHMLMTFEGFTLKVRVKDTIELVGGVPSV